MTYARWSGVTARLRRAGGGGLPSSPSSATTSPANSGTRPRSRSCVSTTAHLRVGQHVRQPLRGVGGVQGHVGAARP